MIQQFKNLEGFFKARAREVLAFVCGSPLSFASLPPKLQVAATRGALGALAFQGRIGGGDLDITVIQKEAAAIGSTLGTAYSFPGMTFGYDRSNLSDGQVKEFLTCMGVVSDPWRQMTMLSSRLGLGGLPLDTAFRNAADARNAAAHDIAADVSPMELQDFHQASLSMAVSFDALVSRAARKLCFGVAGNVTEAEIRVRELRQRTAQVWAEVPQGAHRAACLHQRVLDAPAAMFRATTKRELLVQFDLSGRLVEWWSTDVS
jgi:hypothetical protein